MVLLWLDDCCVFPSILKYFPCSYESVSILKLFVYYISMTKRTFSLLLVCKLLKKINCFQEVGLSSNFEILGSNPGRAHWEIKNTSLDCLTTIVICLLGRASSFKRFSEDPNDAFCSCRCPRPKPLDRWIIKASTRWRDSEHVK